MRPAVPLEGQWSLKLCSKGPVEASGDPECVQRFPRLAQVVKKWVGQVQSTEENANILLLGALRGRPGRLPREAFAKEGLELWRSLGGWRG